MKAEASPTKTPPAHQPVTKQKKEMKFYAPLSQLFNDHPLAIIGKWLKEKKQEE